MLDSSYKDPTPHGTPELVLGRTWIHRILIGTTLLPASALLSLGAGAAYLRHEYEIAVVCGVLSLFAAGATIGLWWTETGREIRVYETGIEQQRRAKRTYLRWEEIQEIRLDALRPRSVQIVGNGGTIGMGSADHGLAEALERILEEVGPRLVAHALERVQCGSVAQFGTASVGPRGIALKGDSFVPVGEVEKLELAGSKLSLRKKGTWLGSASVPVATVPNVHALLGVHHVLAGGTPPPAVAARLARSRYV